MVASARPAKPPMTMEMTMTTMSSVFQRGSMSNMITQMRNSMYTATLVCRPENRPITAAEVDG